MNKYENSVQLSQIVGTNFIKMNKLSQLIGTAFAGSSATSVSIYIDTYSIVKSVLGCNSVWEHENQLTELILDICVYYRKYFRGLGVDTKFYIISSYNLPIKNKQVMPEYNSSFVMRLTSGITGQIKKNMECLKVLCPYLQGIYFIECSYESAVCMYNLIKDNPDKNPSIILSKDPYNLQVIGLLPNTVYLRPSKYKGSDNSRIAFDHKTFWDEFYASSKVNNNDVLVSPSCISSVLAITKMQCRDFPSLVSTRHVMNFINRTIEAGLLNPSGFNISFAMQALKGRDKNIDAIIENGVINKRFMCIDLPSQSVLYRASIEYKSIVLQDLYDPEAVKHINNEYFKGLLELDYL